MGRGDRHGVGDTGGEAGDALAGGAGSDGERTTDVGADGHRVARERVDVASRSGPGDVQRFHDRASGEVGDSTLDRRGGRDRGGCRVGRVAHGVGGLHLDGVGDVVHHTVSSSEGCRTGRHRLHDRRARGGRGGEGVAGDGREGGASGGGDRVVDGLVATVAGRHARRGRGRTFHVAAGTGCVDGDLLFPEVGTVERTADRARHTHFVHATDEARVVGEVCRQHTRDEAHGGSRRELVRQRVAIGVEQGLEVAACGGERREVHGRQHGGFRTDVGMPAIARATAAGAVGETAQGERSGEGTRSGGLSGRAGEGIGCGQADDGASDCCAHRHLANGFADHEMWFLCVWMKSWLSVSRLISLRQIPSHR